MGHSAPKMKHKTFSKGEGWQRDKDSHVLVIFTTARAPGFVVFLFFATATVALIVVVILMFT